MNFRQGIPRARERVKSEIPRQAQRRTTAVTTLTFARCVRSLCARRSTRNLLSATSTIITCHSVEARVREALAVASP